MLFFRCLFSSLLLMLFSLLSCSSDSEYPYTIVKGDPYNTRLYTLPSGIKLYIARTTKQARVDAALYMPFIADDTLKTLYEQSVYSPEYPLLFAHIGSDVSLVKDCQGSSLVYNNIPSNELENWTVLMRGSFAAFPDSFTIVLFGDVVYDDAVETMVQHFENVPRIPSSSAACNIDEKKLLETIRSQFLENLSAENYKKIASLSDVRNDAKNNIKLLPSPPAKVIFPDIDELKIKSFPKQPRMVVVKNDDAHYTFTLRSRLKEVPVSFLAHIKEYFDASLALEKDTATTVVHIKTDENLHAIEFTISGCSENMQQDVTQTILTCKTLADGDKFYKYLLTNSTAIDVSKNNLENVAIQAATYIAGDKRLCSMYEIAKYSMDALFTSASEVYFSGKDDDSLSLSMLNASVTPPLCDFTSTNDSLARYFLLPVDTDSITTVTLGDAYETVEDAAIISLFNKAVALSSTRPSTQFFYNGALLSAGSTQALIRETFEAAKSFLLYDCSTYDGNVQSLFREYIYSNERGYTSAQFYDALMRLSFSDVEDFYTRHKENADTQLIIGRESCLNLRELKNNGRVVHLTSSELFGY